MENKWGILFLFCITCVQLVLGQYPLLEFGRPQSNGSISPSNWTICPSSLQTLPVNNCTCFLIDEVSVFFQCQSVNWTEVHTVLFHYEQSGISQDFFLYVRNLIGDIDENIYPSDANVTAFLEARQNTTVAHYFSALYVDGAPEVTKIPDYTWAYNLRQIILRDFPLLTTFNSQFIPESLETLVLRETAIQEFHINSTLSNLSNLTHLEISHSLMPLDFFSSPSTSSMLISGFDSLYLANVQTLILRNNSLRDLPPDLLAGMSALQSLDLSHNQLPTLPSSFFHDTFALEEINLHNNSINQLPAELFRTTPYLLLLNLSHNAFTNIPNQLVNRYTSRVEVVDLSNNRIRGFNEGVFSHWRSVRLLNLSNNSVNSLQRERFRGLLNLHVLDLSHNSISEIAPGSFEGLTNIQHIDLRNNMLRIIHSGFLEGIHTENLNRTLVLDISDNKIRVIEEGAINASSTENTAQVILHMNGNSLLCSCRNVWLSRYLVSSNTSTSAIQIDIGSATVYCINSRELMVHDIVELNDENCVVEEIRLFTTALEGVFFAGSILFLLTAIVTLAVLCINLHRRPSSSRTFYPAAYYNPDIYEPTIEIKSISTTTL